MQKLDGNISFVTDCGGPNDPNGVLIGSSLYSGTASITCNTGYVGGGSIKCLASGNWDKTLASKCVLAGMTTCLFNSLIIKTSV